MSTTTDTPSPTSPSARFRPRPARRRLGLALYVVFLASLVLLPELAARLLVRWSRPPGIKPSYFTVTTGYPLREEVIRDAGALQFEYQEYYLFSPRPTSSRTINFTAYFGARATPASVPLAQARERIWAFGGSTMQNLEVDDTLTLANQIVVGLNSHGIPTLLHNFGVGSFHSSLESIKFQRLLRSVPPSERPTMAIFYDGFNEARGAYLYGADRLQRNISSRLRDLIERRYSRVILYSTSELLARYSVFWRDYARQRIDFLLYGIPLPDASEANLATAVNAYATNVRMTRGICDALGIRCLFLLQPLVITRAPLTAIEMAALQSLASEEVAFGRAFYRRAAEMLGGERGFHDLSRIVDGISEPVFFDYGHTSPAMGAVIGRAIADRIRG